MNIYIGIDWREQSHEVTLLNEAGGMLGQLTMPHTLEGLASLDKTCHQLGLAQADCLIAIETAHHLLIDFLWDRGYQQVYVIPPSVIKSSRGRYGQSGARDDRRDSRLIADVLRTDRARLYRGIPTAYSRANCAPKCG